MWAQGEIRQKTPPHGFLLFTCQIQLIQLVQTHVQNLKREEETHERMLFLRFFSFSLFVNQCTVSLRALGSAGLTMASAENNSPSSLLLHPSTSSFIWLACPRTARDSERLSDIQCRQNRCYLPSSCLITCLLQGPRVNGAVDKKSLQSEEIIEIKDSHVILYSKSFYMPDTATTYAVAVYLTWMMFVCSVQ